MKNRLLEIANRASSIVRGLVRNRRGERLGRIEDLVLDVEGGRIEYALLALEGDSSQATRRMVTVPWSALHREEDGPAFILEVSRRTLLAVSVSAPA